MTIIIIVVVSILVTFGLVKLVDKFFPSKFKPVLIAVLWIIIGYLGYQTFQSVYAPIQFNKIKEKRFLVVVNSLKDIRDAQLAYKQVNGKFAGDFDALVKFIDTAQFVLTERRDTSVLNVEKTKLFGGVEFFEDEVVIDTLGFASIKDSLFKNSDHYKNMMIVPGGKDGAKFQLKSGFVEQNDIQIPVFEVSVKKEVVLFDQDKDLLIQENQVVSVEGVNGDAITLGSMEEVTTKGNWPLLYDSKK